MHGNTPMLFTDKYRMQALLYAHKQHTASAKAPLKNRCKITTNFLNKKE